MVLSADAAADFVSAVKSKDGLRNGFAEVLRCDNSALFSFTLYLFGLLLNCVTRI